MKYYEVRDLTDGVIYNVYGEFALCLRIKRLADCGHEYEYRKVG